MASGATSTPAFPSSRTRQTRKFFRSWLNSISTPSLLRMGRFRRQTARPLILFRSSPSLMTEISINARTLFLAAATLMAMSVAPLRAQDTAATSLALSLGDAARLAAQQSALAQGARLRANEAQARVRERRSELLPNV